MEFSRKARFKTTWGDFNYVCAKNADAREHSLLWLGDVTCGPAPLLRVQSSCLTSTALGGIICDCAEQLSLSFELIASKGRGAVIYLEQEGRGHGLFQKVETMCEMNCGKDTVDAFESRGMEADIRSFQDVAPILCHIKFHKQIRMITNNPQKIAELESNGFIVEERVPMVVPERPEIEGYMQAKKMKLGHLI